MPGQWIAVAAADELEDNATLRVTIQGQAICLYSLPGAIFATQDQCTHGSASLAEGTIYGEDIECPLHRGMFHIPTGRAVGVPCTEALRTYDVKVDGGKLLIFLRA